MENNIIKSKNDGISRQKTEESKDPFNSLDDGKYWITIKNHEITTGPDKMAKDLSWLYGIIICIVVLIAGMFVSGVVCDRLKTKTSGNVNITIESIREKSDLHVLTISESVTITDTGKDDSKGVEAWTSFSGSGDFVVDLKNSEFLIDNARKTVIVKTPDVSIDKDNFSLNYQDTEVLLFDDSLGNENYRYGVEISQNQFNKAYLEIYDNLFTNPYYYDIAKTAAEKIIESLVKGCNKNVDGLNVKVEVGALS